MDFLIPQALKEEHEELHSVLEADLNTPGRIGQAVKDVANVLHPHFVEENEYAMPPLNLLPSLAQGKVTPEMADVLRLTDHVKKELPRLLQEHKAIVAAVQRLITVAGQENRNDLADFGQRLILHAQVEEQVLYPTAILVGDYVRQKLNW